MYIGNMVIVKLEANIGNIVDWKYKNRFETKKVDWKQSCVMRNIGSNIEYTIMAKSIR
jgi:hypothetical protein